MKKLLLGLMACGLTTSVFAAGFDGSLVEKFGRGKSVIKNIHKLEKLQINTFSLEQMPWTSSYLPALRGYGADPYATNGSNIISFKRNLKKADKKREKFSDSQIELTTEMIANLSTADKYDLLTGQFKAEFSLAQGLWNQADFLHEKFGKLTFWTGMCHGWGPASIAWPAPENTVYVKSADGKYDIPFYPNDIKGLLSMAFANNLKAYYVDHRIQSESRPDHWGDESIMPIHGWACRDRKVKVDQDGRAIIPVNYEVSNCEDVNAAFWHLTVVNLMGRHQQGLVVDIDHNETVNNHPTAGYQIKYFNPTTGKENPLAEAIVPVDVFGEDLRKKYRDPNTTHIVGVEMNMNFVNYQFFNMDNAQSVDLQKYKERAFIYDLELDKDGNIIGGEWKSHKRNKVKKNLFGKRKPGEKPDFIWYAPVGLKAQSYDEPMVSGHWQEGEPLPVSWIEAAKMAAGKNNLDYAGERDANGNLPFRPQPEVIFSIAERLLELSRK